LLHRHVYTCVLTELVCCSPAMLPPPVLPDKPPATSLAAALSKVRAVR
jgi:hypothetical protein